MPLRGKFINGYQPSSFNSLGKRVLGFLYRRRQSTKGVKTQGRSRIGGVTKPIIDRHRVTREGARCLRRQAVYDFLGVAARRDDLSQPDAQGGSRRWPLRDGKCPFRSILEDENSNQVAECNGWAEEVALPGIDVNISDHELSAYQRAYPW